MNGLYFGASPDERKTMRTARTDPDGQRINTTWTRSPAFSIVIGTVWSALRTTVSPLTVIDHSFTPSDELVRTVIEVVETATSTVSISPWPHVSGGAGAAGFSSVGGAGLVGVGGAAGGAGGSGVTPPPAAPPA